MASGEMPAFNLRLSAEGCTTMAFVIVAVNLLATKFAL